MREFSKNSHCNEWLQRMKTSTSNCLKVLATNEKLKNLSSRLLGRKLLYRKHLQQFELGNPAFFPKKLRVDEARARDMLGTQRRSWFHPWFRCSEHAIKSSLFAI